MTTTLTATNDFHGTSCEVPVIETYETNYGGFVAVIKAGHLTWAGKQLCGVSDCVCSGPFVLTNEDGRVYSIITPEK